MFKNRLQEYAQKTSLPLPVYTTVNEGQDHLPQFKCSVTVNGVRYDSPPGYKYKKEAENAAAQVAVEDLRKLGLDVHFKKTKLLKNVLSELAVKKNIPLPTYQFTQEGIAHCPTFTATVEINGESYTGAPGYNKKEAARNAAYEAIQSIRTQDCNSFPQIELYDETEQNNDSRQEFKVTNAVSKLPTDNSTSKNQLLVGTGSHSAENTEKLNVKNVPTVPEKINVENPCEVGLASEKSMGKDSGEVENGKPSINESNPGLAPVEKPQQDPILVEQHGLKEEMTDLIENKEHGFKQLEGMQQGSQEIVLTESIVKRIRSEHEDAEHMSDRKKKLKKKNKAKMRKSDGTA